MRFLSPLQVCRLWIARVSRRDADRMPAGNRLDVQDHLYEQIRHDGLAALAHSLDGGEIHGTKRAENHPTRALGVRRRALVDLHERPKHAPLQTVGQPRVQVRDRELMLVRLHGVAG